MPTSPTSDSKSILALTDKLESFFKENAYPMKNEAVLRRIKFLCGQLGAHDYYVAENAAEIDYLAERFFSARKHATYPGGADEIYNRIARFLLPRIRVRAKNIAHDERNQ